MTSSEQPPIHRAQADETATVAAIIAGAFRTLDVAAWLVPDPSRREPALAGQFEILVEHAIENGHVDMYDDGSGVAVWVHVTDGPVPAPVDYARRLADATGDDCQRFTMLDRLFEVYRPAEPHHHLEFLAVIPTRQGRGRGSALLDHHLRHLDSAGCGAYLEATCPASRRLYERHDFTGGEPFRLPDDGPPVWPMWRSPTDVGGRR